MKKFVIILFLAIGLSSCEESFEILDIVLGKGLNSIELGMTESEVSSALGISISFDKTVGGSSNTKTVRYKDDKTYYYFTFEDDKLTRWWQEDRYN